MSDDPVLNADQKINVQLVCQFCEPDGIEENKVQCPDELIESENGWVYPGPSSNSAAKKRFWFRKKYCELIGLTIRRPLSACINAPFEQNGYGASQTGYTKA